MRIVGSLSLVALSAWLTLVVPGGSNPGAVAAEAEYPRVVRVRYEAKDHDSGGHVVVWLEREKIWYGLDKRLYPAAKYLEVSHITTSPGSPAITLIEIATLNNQTPEYFHLVGIARFRVTGMTLKSSNVP